MDWVALGVGFCLVVFAILAQAYSLKTKRGVAPPETRTGRIFLRLVLFFAGCLLIAAAVARILQHRYTGH